MTQVVVLFLKMLVGGAFVVVFSLVAEVLRPKSFSGLFAAAPSVAAGSLLITAVQATPAKAGLASSGMVAGSVGMVAACLAAMLTVPRLGSIWGSVAAWVAWGVVSAAAYVLLP